MKTARKLSAAVLAAALSLCIFPRVIADDTAESGTTIVTTAPAETTAETSAETILFSESETASETTSVPESESTSETTVPTEGESVSETSGQTESEPASETENEDHGIAPASLLPLEPEGKEVYIERYSGIPSGLEDQPKCSFYVSEALRWIPEADPSSKIAYSYDTSNYRSKYSLIGRNDIITPYNTYNTTDETYGYISYTDVYFIIGGDQLDPASPCYKVRLKFKYFDVAEDSEVLIDRTSGMPTELQDKSEYTFLVKEALQNIPQAEKYNISYSTDGEDFEPIKPDDTMELSSTDYYGRESEALIYNKYIYFLLSDGSSVPTRYRINVKLKLFNNFKEKVRVYGEDSERIAEFSNEYIYLSNTKFEKGEYPSMLILLPEGYSEANVKVYEGEFDKVSDLDPSKDITDKILYTGAKDRSPYPMDNYGYTESNDVFRSAYKYITFAITMPTGSTKLIQRHYRVYITPNSIGATPQDPQKVKTFYEYYGDELYPTGELYLYETDKIEDADIKVTASYHDYIGDKHDDDGITFACFGSYSKESDVKDKTNIRDAIFSYEGADIDVSLLRSETKYYEDGTEMPVYALDLTFIDYYEHIYNVTVYVMNYTAEEIEPTPSDETTFVIRDIQKEPTDPEGKKTAEKYNKYVVSSYDDSYYNQKNYRTVFILDDKEAVPRGTNIYPVFYSPDGSEVYCDGSPIHSGVTPLDFIPEAARHYTVAAENKINTGNYWVTYVTQNKNGSKLFVNGANVTDHYSEKTHKPQREVFFSSSGSYHDILFANIGDQQMTGIKAELTKANGVELDPYWNVTSSKVSSLAAFTTTKNPDNIAKLRLIPKDFDEDKFTVISGLLTISADGNLPVEIEITGAAGTPRITTENNIKDGILYVPYQSIIMTNSTDAEHPMEFSLESGKLPEGLSLLKTGEVYGIPKETGTFTFTVKAEYKFSDEKVLTARKTLTITIKENDDNNVDSANNDPDQGEKLTDRVSRNITLHYDGMDGDLPNITSIEIGSNLFHSEGEYSDFKGFYIDGKLLMQNEDYTAEEGSTKITVMEQTFKKLKMENGSRHTLAAEFKDSNGKLTRSAQNVYLNYIGKDEPQPGPDGPTHIDTPNDNNGGSKTNGSVGLGGAVNGGSSSRTVNVEINIISADNEPIPGISVELHSDPMYSETDSEGNVSFENVEFGRHTLFIRDKDNSSTASKKFTLVSGSKTKMNGDIITAKAGGTLSLAVEYDGSKIKIISAALEDVSSSAGTVKATPVTLDSNTKASPWKLPIIIAGVVLTAGISVFVVLIVRRKRRN